MRIVEDNFHCSDVISLTTTSASSQLAPTHTGSPLPQQAEGEGSQFEMSGFLATR